MIRQLLLLFLMILVLSVQLLGQRSSTVRGFVEDATTGERLIGANLQDLASSLGTSSNNFGYFSYSYLQDSLNLRISYIGYSSLDTLLVGIPAKDIVIKLNSQINLSTVEVTSTQSGERISEQVQMSRLDIPIEQIKHAPALFGETDVLKALQYLPGVSGGSEGTAGLYVRGGSPDQNLVLLDGVPVYNVSHVLGIFSVFNADAINSVSLVKGGFPARYGGRLSSVLEINMKDGHKDKWQGEGGIGIISSRLTLNGPVGKKTRVLVSGRRTYLDLLAKPFVAIANKQNSGDSYSTKFKFKVNFYDLNAKVRHDINDEHTLYFSAYMGGDIFGTDITDSYDGSAGRTYKDTYGAGVNWGNKLAAVRWNYEIGPRLFLNSTATFSDYQINFYSEFDYEEEDGREQYLARYVSGIRDFGLRSDLSFIPNPNHYLRTGLSAIHHTYSPGALTQKTTIPGENIETKIGSEPEEAVELSAYVEDEWRLSPKLALNVGIHSSGFYNQKWFGSVQPRIATRYVLPKGWGLKASYAQMAQFINLLTSEALALPTDLWVPSNANVDPQRAWQGAVGVAKEINQSYEISSELFYKSMKNVVSYRPGSSFFDFRPGDRWEDKIVQGDGEVYGLELLAQKKLGRTTGWVGYTLSWNWRSFPSINEGQRFPFRYDRRHDFSVLVTHAITKRITFTGAWIFATGNAITVPQLQQFGDFTTDGSRSIFDPTTGRNEVRSVTSYRDAQQGEGKNQFRLSNTHRLDFSFEFAKKKKWGERAWVVGAYNAYSHKNPFFLLATDKYNSTTGESKRIFQEISILPVVPSISYKFKF